MRRPAKRPLRARLVVDRGEDIGVRPQLADLEKHPVGAAEAHEKIVHKGDPALRSIIRSWRFHRSSLRRARQERDAPAGRVFLDLENISVVVHRVTREQLRVTHQLVVVDRLGPS